MYWIAAVRCELLKSVRKGLWETLCVLAVYLDYKIKSARRIKWCRDERLEDTARLSLWMLTGIPRDHTPQSINIS